MNRCHLLRRRQPQRWLRDAIRTMLTDRFSPEEIALGLRCELSEVLAVIAVLAPRDFVEGWV